MFNFERDREQTSEKFNGMYRGVVVDNKDPKGWRRVKVKFFTVYDNVPDVDIPWAIYADMFMMGAASSGSSIIPDEGDLVWGFFENGDHMQPVFFAGAPAAPHQPEMGAKQMPEKRGEPEYPKNRVIETKVGHIVEIDDTDGNTRIRVKHKSGTQYIMYDNGDLYEYIVGDHKRFVVGDVEEHITGSTTKYVSGAITEQNGGNRKHVTGGNTDMETTGTTTIQSTGNIDNRAANIHMNSSTPSPASPVSPTIPELVD